MKKVCMVLAALVLLLAFAMAEEEVFYVLEYDGNGGYCGIEPQVIYPGETITLSNSWCSWDDHVFLGWATTPDATEAEYQRKAAFTSDKDVTLYAVWAEAYDLGVIDPARTYTISYPTEREFAYLLFEVPEDGYYYIHSLGQYWKSGSGTTWIEAVKGSYNRAYPEEVNDDFEFVVELKAGTRYRMMYYHAKDPLKIEFSNEGFCLVKYDGNGGYCGIDPQVAKAGETITLSNSWCSWEDHVFLGWATTPDATDAEYQRKAPITVTGDVTLYAVWAEAYDLGVIDPARTYTISYPTEREFAYLLFEVPEDGYYYIHSLGQYWKSGSGTTWIEAVKGSYNRAYPEEVNDDFEFVVELKAGTRYRMMYYHAKNPLKIEFSNEGFCLVKYDGNGGYCGIDPQVAKAGETITLSDSWCSWDDHVFLGWATTPDATEAEYKRKAPITVTEDVTLYAVWAEGKNLGTISGRREETVSYPAEKTFAYILFKAGYTGYYHIYSTGDYLDKGSGTTWLSPVEDSYDRTYPDTSNDDYSFVVKLTAGKTYRIMYYHVTDPLPIVFQPQYEGKNYESDIQLTSEVRDIGEAAFEGTGLTHVAIPASMEEVNARTFADCSKLESVLFYGMNTRIAPDAFAGCKDLVIIAPVGSTAQAFAEQMGWDFLELK